MEQSIFDSLLPLLAEPQVPRLERARQYRARCRSMLRFPQIYELRGASVDLSEVIDRSKNEPWFEIMDRETLDALLQAYEPTLTYLRRQQYQSYVKATVDGPRNLATRPAMPPKDDPRYAATLGTIRMMNREFEAIWRPAGAFERRIHEFNNSYVETFASMLGSATASALRAVYYERAYPLVFPNEFDAEGIGKDIIAASQISDDQKYSLEALLEVYREKRDRLSKQMMTRSDDWFEKLVRYRGDSAAERDEFRREMREMESRRRALAMEFLRTCKDMLPERMPGPCAAQIAELEKKFEEGAMNPRLVDPSLH